MALFNKFFQSQRWKNETTKQQKFTQSQGPHKSLFPFSNEQVRVLLFRECDWTGRRLLFDSSAVEKVNVTTRTQSLNTNKANGNNATDNKDTQSQSFIEICNGYGYVYNHPASDSNNIGEMVFGSVAMSFKGTSLKVHWLQDPKRILCSQVFLSPTSSKHNFCQSTSTSMGNCDSKPNQSTKSNSSNSFSLSLSLCVTDKLNDLNEKQSTIPLDVPLTLEQNSYAFSGCDSGYSGIDLWATMSNSSYYHPQSDGSSVASMFSTDPSILNSSRKLSVDSAILVDAAMSGRSSDGCLQRRILRNLSTSFENNLSRSDFIGYFDENQMINNQSSIPMIRRHSEHCGESVSNPELVRKRKNTGKDNLKPPQLHFSSYTPRTKVASQRRSKIGLAVCIRFSESVEDEMQLFCSEHIALLESMLCRLRAAAEMAYGNQKKFHQLMLHAWITTSSWITDLFTAPRINEPVWLSLSNGYTERPNNLAKHFMTELCWLLNSADTKDTNFFISTLLTAILTNHLGWVATVAPIINGLPNNDQDLTIHQSQAKMLEISKFHPYNVLWAQLSDLYGSVGSPSRLAKTIICGAHTLTINKVLNVLTYFVRCGEIQRVESTKVLDEDEIEDIILSKNHRKKVSILNSNNAQCAPISEPKGLLRSKTCFKDIATITNENANCIAFTLTENDLNKNARCADKEIQLKKILNSSNNTVKLMVTRPNDDKFEYETASEALDFVLKKIEPNEQKSNISNSLEGIEQNEKKPLNSLWSIDTVTDGIAIKIWRTENKPERADEIELKRSQSLSHKSNTVDGLRKSRTMRKIVNNGTDNTMNAYSSISDLVTNRNSFQQTSNQLKAINYEKIDQNQLDPSANVVFVLGDNDILSGLKTPPPTPIPDTEKFDESKQLDSPSPLPPPPPPPLLTENNSQSSDASPAFTSTSKSNKPETKKKKHCTHKKHSGVKFNFEQYPQIVTNYMKNKNLDIESYDFLEKGLKLEQENTFNYGASSSVLPKLIPDDIQELDEQEEEEQCECCENTFRILQTPSNATELEFSNEDGNYPVPINMNKSLEIPKPAVEIETIIEDRCESNKTESNILQECQNNKMNGTVNEKIDEIVKMKMTKNLELITLPIPKTEFINNTKDRRRIRAGYVPSLFVGITDHFIPDMVLQGIAAPLTKWEPILMQNLTLSSHCATFEQIPTENVAIIANIDKWDVKLVSSQSYSLSSGGLSGPIGMSQLVSTMLETVHAMWLAGTSPYQCMSFMESKLKEIYLQSEALAAFLLATEFCSLNTVTTALNLSANDVPLLLSVASIHSPKVTKKYGISFR